MTKTGKRARTLGVLVVGLAVAITTSTQAKPGYLAAVQQLGYPAESCTYCHLKAAGGAGWNARGKWLRREKRRRNARDVDVSWLSRYRGR